MQCAAAKRKCTLTKEGSKKNRRVYSRNVEGTGTGKKTEKGKGKKRIKRNAKGTKKKKTMRIMQRTENWSRKLAGGIL